MKKILCSKQLSFALVILFSCAFQSFFYKSSDFKSVKIGNQAWMVENLNVDHFQNGDKIPEAKTAEEFKLAGNRNQPAWCYYDCNIENEKKHGKLYNWFAVNDSRGLAPKGWHVPSKSEWDSLKIFVGTERILLQMNAALKLKSTEGWNNNGNGTNETGLTILPSGIFEHVDGKFKLMGDISSFWSNTSLGVKGYHTEIGSNNNVFAIKKDDQDNGYSVRCVKN
jgi:uncharacterized protein (TIGR02145 family)